MPRYQLRCDRCGEEWEQKMSVRDYEAFVMNDTTRCANYDPACGGTLRQVPSRFFFRINLP